MAEFVVFETSCGKDIAIDMDLVDLVWAGGDGFTLLYMSSREEYIEVVLPFDKFVKDWIDHTDARPKKKKPRAKVARGSNHPAQLIKLGDLSSL